MSENSKASSSPELRNMDKILDELSRPPFYQIRFDSKVKMPSLEALRQLMQRLRAVFFPGYYNPAYPSECSQRYHLAANLDSVYRILAQELHSGYCFSRSNGMDCEDTPDCRDLAGRFMDVLPDIRRKLEGDVQAAYEGDPAAKSPGETIFCYPSIKVMTNHRVAHELYRLGVPLIPRIISEMAHAETGIDVHPGASIGDNFFIDHGTGVVIGETCIIGNGCQLYQGVTLGALSFPKEEDGSLTKGLPRHPILEDDVVVYSGATILGRITIGRGSMIGGNVWVTKDVPPGSKVVQQRSTTPAPDDTMRGKGNC